MPDTFVLDCSVAAKWLLPEPDRDPALRLLDSYIIGETLLIAPDLLLAEFASLIAKRNRLRQLSSSQAREAFYWMTRYAPRLLETRPLLAHALDLSLRYHLSLWDCVYLALAVERGCLMLTADARLFRGGNGRHPVLRML